VFSPDGAYILTASSDHTAKLWDPEGNLLADLNKHKDEVYSAVFSPDGTRILTASSDHTAKLWDPEGKLLADLNKHKGDVNSAVFSPDGTRILTASSDGTAKIWYTPEAIYERLKTAPIPPLTDEEKKELGIK
jgi:WD40 repeat protein